MDCPVCKNSAMVALELNDVEVDHCFDCAGIWLDAGELEMMFVNPDDAKSLIESFQPAVKNSEQKRPCPICRKKMEKISVGSDDETVIIDRCKKGHGLWFDPGELTDIISKACLDSGNRIKQLLKEIFKAE